MGAPVVHLFSFPSWDEEHGRYITRQVEGLARRVRKLTEQITGEHPEWTPEQVKAEVRSRLRRPREER